MPFCSSCGLELEDSSNSCPKCQPTNLPETTAQVTPDKPKWYYSGWFVFLSFFFCWPVGIILLLKSPTASKTMKVLGSVFIGLMFLLIFIGGPSGGSGGGSQYGDFPAYNSPWDGSVSQVEEYLKDTLKDPDSLEFQEWYDIKPYDNHYVVRCTYRAKNSFGGYVFKDQVFHLDAKTGKVFDVTDLN